MQSPSYRLGHFLLACGTCLVLAALGVAMYDAAGWYIDGIWSDTSLQSVLGPFPPETSAEVKTAIATAWRQPLWFLMVLASIVFAYPGSMLMGVK